MDDDIGIFSEGHRRTQLYSGQCEALRRKILGVGPTMSGAYAETVNPFERPKVIRRLERAPRQPFWSQHQASHIKRRIDNGTLTDDLDVTPLEIVQTICLVANICSGDMMNSHCREWRISRPRQMAMYLIARYSDLSLVQIGHLFKKDHTTVLHAIRVVPTRIEAGNAEERAMLDVVISRLREF